MNAFNSFMSDTIHNSCTVNPNTKGEIDCISLTTKHMKLFFNEYPEIVLLDTTHKTNKNGYKLLSFMVHDCNGNGQHIQHSFLNRETAGNFQNAITHLKKVNKNWDKIKAFMIDKDFTEMRVLENVRIILISYFYVTFYLLFTIYI